MSLFMRDNVNYVQESYFDDSTSETIGKIFIDNNVAV